MFEFFNDIGNYETRMLGRVSLDNGIDVSTAFTSDEGYETALIDANGTHPVERYGFAGKDDAEKGHLKWIEFAKHNNGKQVVKLGGMDGLVDDKTITLKGK